MSNELIQIPEEMGQLKAKAEAALSAAQSFVVNSQQAYEAAGSDLKAIKARQKEVDEARKSITRPLDEEKKRITAFFEPAASFLNKAESILKSSMMAYASEQDRLRRVAEEAARKEQERLRKEAEKKAAKAETKGDAEKAADIRAAVPVVVAMQVEQPKVAGISMRTIWKARVIDAAQVPREYMIVDLQKIDRIAKESKGAVQVAGIEFYSEQVMAAGQR